MVFFKCEATRCDRPDREQLRQEADSLPAELAELTFQLYQDSDGQSMAFAASVQSDHATVGVLAPTPAEAEKQARTYLHWIPIQIDDYTMEEITCATMLNLLAQADHKDYIPDRNDVLEMFGMDDLTIRGRFPYGESMIQVNTSPAAMHAVAQDHFFEDTLTPELDRIAQGNKGQMPVGHPVHYLLHTDDRVARRTVYKALLSALYQQGRIRNQRYTFLDLSSTGSFNFASMEALYRCSEGGAVVIRYDQDEDESEFGGGEAVVNALCDIAVRYKNQVLTILCLPAAANRSKAAFLAHWGNTAFVELKEDIITSNRAQQYLKNKAKAYRLRADKQLTAAVMDDSKTYTATQLNQTFDRWHSNKLRRQIYPQYKSTAPVAVAVQNIGPVGGAYERLQGLIGLTEAKEMMNKALGFFKMQKLFADRGISTDQPSMHMVFTGNPGTAKTTVARLFAEIMRDNGVLSCGDLIEVGRADLVGKYVGQTAPLVKAAFERAKGGVLFIDEAYSLVDDRSGMYGDEAINTIVQEMENNREDTIVIFAGYPDKMEAFLDRNPGLRSRIAFHIPFADYSPEELCAIAAHIADGQKLTIEEAAQDKLHRAFAAACKQSDFGNGRYARNLIEKAKMAQANRLMTGDLAAITDEQLHTLCAADIEEPKTAPTNTVTMGFCA